MVPAGSGLVASQLSNERSNLYNQFAVESQDRSLRGISSEIVEQTTMMTVCDNLEECNKLFAEVCEMHNCSELVIRPTTGVHWVGAAKLRHGRDVQIYGQVSAVLIFAS